MVLFGLATFGCRGGEAGERGAVDGGPTYGDMALDSLMKTAEVEHDPARAKALWSQAQRIIIDEAYYTVLFEINDLISFERRFQNVKPNAVRWNDNISRSGTSQRGAIGTMLRWVPRRNILDRDAIPPRLRTILFADMVVSTKRVAEPRNRGDSPGA